jgi:hypothetical protein
LVKIFERVANSLPRLIGFVNKSHIPTFRHFSLSSSYDTVGRWRENYMSNSAIDSSYEIDGSPVNGPSGLKEYLLQNKVHYIRNLSRKLLSYGLGRGIYFHDNFIVNKMIENAMRDDYRFSSLIKTVVLSPQFQHK